MLFTGVLEIRRWQMAHMSSEASRLVQIVRERSTLIPFGDLPSRLRELEGRGEMIVHCKSGVRSAKAVKLLREAGFAQAKNLRGGILRWIDAVDPSLPKY